MKLTTFILLAALMQVSAAALAQRVTLAEKTTTLKQLFSEINRQTGYNVIWSSDQVNGERIIPAGFNQAPLLEVLNQVAGETNISYAIEDKNIVIKSKEESLFDKFKDQIKASLAQVTVTAKVYDELGEAMPGVNVRIKNTQNGTTTDSKGNFSITVPDNNSVLVFSFVGYDTQELAAKDIPAGSVITLKVAENNLKEVVINKGYYDEKRELSTGDISIVSSKEIGEQPVSNPILALEGRIPGLQISQTSGMPGSNSTIMLRGQNFITTRGTNFSENNLLYVVDGVPINSQGLTMGALGNPANGIGQGISPFSALNPDDIEDIEVLKDADATAIYGSRGANGVILITTKKGQAGDTKVNIDISQGIGQVTRMMDLLNTQQYLEMRHEALKNDGLTPGSGAYDINGVWDTTRYTNWQKVLIGNTAQYTNVQGSISGGNTNTQFIIGGGYNRQTTVFPGDYGDTKGSGHFTLTHSSSDQKFHAQFTASYIYDSDNVPATDFTQYITLAPDAPALYNPNGSLNWQIVNGRATWSNPLASQFVNANAITENLITNLDLSYKILPGLQVKGSFGYTDQQITQTTVSPASAQAPPNNTNPNDNSIRFSPNDLKTWIIEPQISYQKNIAKGQFNALAGATFQQNTANSTAYQASGFASEALIENPRSASNFQLSASSNSIYAYEAIYGRLSYDWDEKYLLNFTARRDGSSRFGPGNQFGNFGAIGAGWMFSKEKFIQNALPFLSFGKLRGSYGITGGDNIGDYQYLSTYSANSFTYQGNTGLSPTSIGNPYFHWQVVKKFEGAIELGFLQDRLNFTADYYRDRTNDQLLNYPLPAVTGFGSVVSNLPAIIQNTGAEFTLNTVNIKSKDFQWNTSFNLTVPKNKLVAYPDIANSPYEYQYVVGQSLFIRQLYHFTGVNPQTGDYQFLSVNSGTNTNNPAYLKDFVTTAPVTQKYFGGLQNSLNYKGFRLDVFFQFVKQLGYNYMTKFPEAGFSNYNEPTVVLERWQSPGNISNIAKFSTEYGADPHNDLASSNAIISDASFIRLKNLALSYQLPASWQKSARLRSARVYLQAQNLFTITNYLGLDPETQGLSLPPLRMITLGIQASL